jgi:hypothetical protein
MPPKPDQGFKKHKFGIFGDKNAKNSASKPSSGHATPSASGTSNTQSAIRNARLAIDGLKTASDMSVVLGPLKLVCFALTLIVDTAEVGLQCVYTIKLTSMNAQGVVKNNEDLRNLLEKLQRQLKFVQDKTNSLADPRFRPSGAAVQGLVDSLQAYTSYADLSPGSSVLTKLQGIGSSRSETRVTQPSR